MNLSLSRLLYVSEPARPDPALSTVAEILAVSDRNNRRDGLTGALVLTQDRFLQVLEGTNQDLARLLSRLQADPRHRNLLVLSQTAIATRLFAGWAMAAARLDPERSSRMTHLIDLATYAPHLAAIGVRDLVGVSPACDAAADPAPFLLERASAASSFVPPACAPETRLRALEGAGLDVETQETAWRPR